MQRKLGFSVLIAAAVVMSGPAAPTNRYVVKNNPTAAAPYDTWVNAAPDIQTAIDAALAANGDEVVVAPATYDSGGMKRDPGRYLTNRVVINKSIVVRSRDNDPANTIIQGAWEPGGTNGPAAIRGVFMVAGAQLIGFTITNGATVVTNEATPPTHAQIGECGRGGGIYATSLNTLISNCIIAGNAAFGDRANAIGGGGAYQGTYYDCAFIGNQVGPARTLGGGVFNANLYRCQLHGNRAPPDGVDGMGGGAFRGTLYDCVVSNNHAAYGGGGVAGWSAAAPVKVYDTEITANITGERGGGAYGHNSDPGAAILSNCTVMGNVSSNLGAVNAAGAFICTLIGSRIVSNLGSVAVYGGVITNCIVAYNSSYGVFRAPAGICNSLIYANLNGVYLDPNQTLDSCTIVGNGNRGVFLEAAGTAVIRNCIVYSNQNANWVEGNVASSLMFTNSCATPARPGWHASNITNNPQFLESGVGYGTALAGGNYRLAPGSPCIDGGLYRDWMENARDLDGAPRVNRLTKRVDMGCYEHIFRASMILVR